MYIYLRKLKRVKDPNRKKSKKGKKGQKSSNPSDALETYTNEAHVIEERELEDLIQNSDLIQDENILDQVVEDMYQQEKEPVPVEQQQPEVVLVNPIVSPVIKSPTGGGMIYLQKLKKVKKRSKKDKHKNQPSVKDFFAARAK